MKSYNHSNDNDDNISKNNCKASMGNGTSESRSFNRKNKQTNNLSDSTLYTIYETSELNID